MVQTLNRLQRRWSQLDDAVISLNLDTADYAAEAVEWLAADADVNGGDAERTDNDNITAVVLDLAQQPNRAPVVNRWPARQGTADRGPRCREPGNR